MNDPFYTIALTILGLCAAYLIAYIIRPSAKENADEPLSESEAKTSPIDQGPPISSLQPPKPLYRWYLEFIKDGKRHKVEIAPPFIDTWADVKMEINPPSVFDGSVRGYNSPGYVPKQPRDARGRFVKKAAPGPWNGLDIDSTKNARP